MRGGAAVLRASGASLVAGGPARGLTEQVPARVGASRPGLWGEPGRHPSRPMGADISEPRCTKYCLNMSKYVLFIIGLNMSK